MDAVKISYHYLIDTLEKYNGKVIRLSPEERARWIKKSEPMYDSLPDNMKKIAQEIRDTLKQ